MLLAEQQQAGCGDDAAHDGRVVMPAALPLLYEDGDEQRRKDEIDTLAVKGQQ